MDWHIRQTRLPNCSSVTGSSHQSRTVILPGSGTGAGRHPTKMFLSRPCQLPLRFKWERNYFGCFSTHIFIRASTRLLQQCASSYLFLSTREEKYLLCEEILANYVGISINHSFLLFINCSPIHSGLCYNNHTQTHACILNNNLFLSCHLLGSAAVRLF